MMSKNLYIALVFYVSLIALTCAATAYGYFYTSSLITVLAGGFIVFIESVYLVRYLNKTNRNLTYYIDSIRNEDTSIKFQGNIKNKPVRDLYNSLNIVNDMLRNTKIEVAYNEKLLETMIEYSASGFIMIDEKGDFKVMNNTARKYLNVEYTSNLMQLKQADYKLFCIFRDIQPGKTRTHKFQQNARIIEYSISVAEIKYYDKKYRIISIQDISSELEDKELESWHKLFRVITHEIMNSIAPITSLSQTLTRLYQNNETVKTPNEVTEKTIEDTVRGLSVIDEMSHGLMNFVESYRQLNKIPTPKKVKIELHPWLILLKTLILEMIKDTPVALSITISSDCDSIYSDEKLLNQVVLNLVKNSIDALSDKPDGAITIKAQKTENHKTSLTIHDNGQGIPQDDLDKIFVPFFTTKENGNGIGLSLSKQIMRKLDGGISVNSQAGKGTSVVLVF
ncbi:MAG: sensor histidine kinase [Bacteroidota bacterium]